jgi:L-threonylcarbamoyladenylate synthase
VIFPTDTVYGLGTNPWSVDGVRRCYEIKKRDKGKKMPVLVSDFRAASQLVKFGVKSKSLAAAFWPGKLTIILRAENSTLPQELVGPERTLAVRIPNHECCLKLISACGGGLIGTSANVSGEEPFTNPFDPKLTELSSSADYFVAGSCGASSGLSSTIVDATDENSLKIIREGAISASTVLAHLENMSNTDFS